MSEPQAYLSRHISFIKNKNEIKNVMYKYQRASRMLKQMAASSEKGYLAGVFKLQLGWRFSRKSKEYRY